VKVLDTPLPGAKIIEPKVFGDARGFFMESWNARRYGEHGLPTRFVQSNVSRSARNVLRGLHFQHPQAQGKLVYVLEGAVFDVAVDIRPDSPTFGQWHGVTLSADNFRQFYVPEGFAHGFCVLSDSALFAYHCTEFYAPEYDAGVLWNDPNIGIQWPVEHPLLSEKDSQLPRLRDIPAHQLPATTP